MSLADPPRAAGRSGTCPVLRSRTRRIRKAASRSRGDRGRHRRGAVRRQSAAVLRDRRMERRAGRLRGLVRQFLDLQRPLRHLSGRSVRPPGAARQGHRQGAAGASRESNAWRTAGRVCNGRCWTGTRRRSNSTNRSAPILMDEWTICRVGGPGADGAGARDAVMEIVLIVAVAENGVIGRRWRHSVAAEIRHAALQGADIGQAGGDGTQDLRLDRPAAARTDQYRRDARPGLSRRTASW